MKRRTERALFTIVIDRLHTIAVIYTIGVLSFSCVSGWAGLACDLTFSVLITTNFTLATVFGRCVQEKTGGTSNFAIKENYNTGLAV